ncbi:MAG TPA: hypothetical protein VN811_03600 [Thermoanaerobaculia bacterium]|nr:hypothetical protein [Thermoanaerobaculia bacterium]HXT50099.1 hypothetical protein [Thermoanaerobaculia bacterium]
MSRSTRRVLPILLAVVLAAALPLAARAAAKESADVKITNRTDWEIHELYFSSVDDENWGPDQLGEYDIGKGESYTLQEIPCDDYDVKIVDEAGDECIVPAVDICGEGQQWTITSGDLLKCQAGTAAETADR